MTPKKVHHWITLPEETVHTPASEAKGKKKAGKQQDAVTHKLFWGVGFIVLIITTFAVLAPTQFSTLIRGSLFDAPGVEQADLGVQITEGIFGGEAEEEPVSDLVEEPAEPEVEEAEVMEEESTPEAPELVEEPGEAMEEVVEESIEEVVDSEEVFQSEPVVEAEEEPVTIAVEPITEAESFEIEPISTEPEDCGEDTECFLAHFADCSPATGKIALMLFDQDLESDVEMLGSKDDLCEYSVTYTKLPLGQLVGKDATCTIEKGEYSEDDFLKLYKNSDEFFEACEGPAIDALQDLEAMVGGFDLDGFEVEIGQLGDIALSGALDFGDLLSGANNLKASAEEAMKKEEEAKKAQDDMVTELQKQIEALEKQREDQNKALQDLTNLVADQMANGTKPSATTGVTTTTSLGQPPALQPGFRQNPYRVTVTPEQVLQQNLAGGVQYTTPQPTYQPQPQPVAQQPTYVAPDRTPDSGPREALMLAILITTMAVMAWGMVRAARA